MSAYNKLSKAAQRATKALIISVACANAIGCAIIPDVNTGKGIFAESDMAKRASEADYRRKFNNLQYQKQKEERMAQQRQKNLKRQELQRKDNLARQKQAILDQEELRRFRESAKNKP